MFVTLGSKPQHDFDRPIDLLSDCHRRIEQFLDVLIRVTADSPDGTLTEAHRRAMASALQYFRTAAPRHTADEEQSLFPRMKSLDDQRVREAMAKIESLEADHQLADKAHAEVEFWCQRWLDEGPLAPAQVRRLAKVLSGLRDLYRRHIAVEDGEVFPLAKSVLPGDQIAEVGREMAGRRGL